MPLKDKIERRKYFNQWRLRNKNKLLKQLRTRYANDPIWREKQLLRTALWKKQNRESVNKKRRTLWDKNRIENNKKARINGKKFRDKNSKFRKKSVVRTAEWRKNNSEALIKHRAIQYLKRDTKLQTKHLPDHLVEAKIQQIKIKRLCKQIKRNQQ